MSDSEEEGTEGLYKIVLVGDQKVGKTTIAQRFTRNIYLMWKILKLFSP